MLTVEYKINLLAPAVGDQLEAVGTVLRTGRTLTVCKLEVYGVEGGGGRSLVGNRPADADPGGRPAGVRLTYAAGTTTVSSAGPSSARATVSDAARRAGPAG